MEKKKKNSNREKIHGTARIWVEIDWSSGERSWLSANGCLNNSDTRRGLEEVVGISAIGKGRRERERERGF